MTKKRNRKLATPTPRPVTPSDWEFIINRLRCQHNPIYGMEEILPDGSIMTRYYRDNDGQAEWIPQLIGGTDWEVVRMVAPADAPPITEEDLPRYGPEWTDDPFREIRQQVIKAAEDEIDALIMGKWDAE